LLQPTLSDPAVVPRASQATQWLQAHLAALPGATLESTAMHDPRFSNTLELAVRFGKTLLVADVEVIDPLLYPLLRRDVQLQGARKVRPQPARSRQRSLVGRQLAALLVLECIYMVMCSSLLPGAAHAAAMLSRSALSTSLLRGHAPCRWCALGTSWWTGTSRSGCS
jgi:hypothetical protein